MVSDAIGRMLAEGQFADDMLQPPRADLDAVLVANLQKSAQAGLQLAGGAGQRPFRLQFAAGDRISCSHNSRELSLLAAATWLARRPNPPPSTDLTGTGKSASGGTLTVAFGWPTGSGG